MDIIEYHKSTTNELKSIQNKIRSLVPNWLEDGMYKESVLRGVLRSFLPKSIDIASGYVVQQTGNRGEHLSSPQIDILIYDNTYPILFKKEEVVIVTADAVSIRNKLFNINYLTSLKNQQHGKSFKNRIDY